MAGCLRDWWPVRPSYAIISGGGAYILKEYKEHFPKNVVFGEDEVEYSNVRGYYNG